MWTAEYRALALTESELRKADLLEKHQRAISQLTVPSTTATSPDAEWDDETTQEPPDVKLRVAEALNMHRDPARWQKRLGILVTLAPALLAILEQWQGRKITAEFVKSSFMAYLTQETSTNTQPEITEEVIETVSHAVVEVQEALPDDTGAARTIGSAVFSVAKWVPGVHGLIQAVETASQEGNELNTEVMRLKEHAENVGRAAFQAGEQVASPSVTHTAQESVSFIDNYVSTMTLCSLASALFTAYNSYKQGAVMGAATFVSSSFAQWMVRVVQGTQPFAIPVTDVDKLRLALEMFDGAGITEAFFPRYRLWNNLKRKMNQDPPVSTGTSAMYYLKVVPMYAISSFPNGRYYLQDITDFAKEKENRPDERNKLLSTSPIHSAAELVQKISVAIMDEHDNKIQTLHTAVEDSFHEEAYKSSMLKEGCMTDARKNFPDLVTKYKHEIDFCAWDSYYWAARLTINAILIELASLVLIKMGGATVLLKIVNNTLDWLTPIMNMVITTTGVCVSMLTSSDMTTLTATSTACAAMSAAMASLFTPTVKEILTEASNKYKESISPTLKSIMGYISHAFSKLSAVKFAHHLRVIFRSEKLSENGLTIAKSIVLQKVSNDLEEKVQRVITSSNSSCTGKLSVPCKADPSCSWTPGVRAKGTKGVCRDLVVAPAPASPHAGLERDLAALKADELRALCAKANKHPSRAHVVKCNQKKADLAKALTASIATLPHDAVAALLKT